MRPLLQIEFIVKEKKNDWTIYTKTAEMEKKLKSDDNSKLKIIPLPICNSLWEYIFTSRQ